MQVLTRFFYFLGRISHHTLGTMVQGGNFIVRKSALDAVGSYNTDVVFLVRTPISRSESQRLVVLSLCQKCGFIPQRAVSKLKGSW